MAHIPSTSHVTFLAMLRRERLLPSAGDVTVQPQQHVEAGDIVARAQFPERHVLLNYAQLLHTAPDKADEFLQKAEGEAVKKGELFAARKGTFGFGKRLVKSPVTGRVVMFTGKGEALLAVLSKATEVRAGMPGQVFSVVENRGVVLESTGALLEGVWGNGRDDYAPLFVIGETPDTTLAAGMVTMETRGNLVAVGHLADEAALKALGGASLKGLIIGTTVPALLPALQKLPFPVLVTEGCGTHGFSAAAFSLLTGYRERPGWLNAQAPDFHTGQRPEFIIPLASPSTPPPPPANGEPLAPGKRVRIVRGADAGQIGTVADLLERATVLPNGLRLPVARVELTALPGTLIKVPFANLENLE